MNGLILSTPDLVSSNFTGVLGEHFQKFIVNKPDKFEGEIDDTPESRIHQLHCRVLKDCQKSWYQPMPVHFNILENEKYKIDLKFIETKLNVDSPWIVQDPLLCYYLPLWLSAMENPCILFHYSEPLECAISLQRVWRFPLSFGLALWESYVLGACRNLENQRYIPVSSNKLRNSTRNHLESIFSGLEQCSDGKIDLTCDSLDDISSIAPKQCVKHEGLSGCLQQSQKEIFQGLEQGKLGMLCDRELSSQSSDILDYYGQLRSGFELIKAERDRYRKQQAGDRDKSSSSENVQIPPGDAPRNQQQGDTLCAVKVHLQGMKALEFFAEPGSPIVEMLQHNLAHKEKTQDELIYLNYGDGDNNAIYFMSSTLLGIETSPQELH